MENRRRRPRKRKWNPTFCWLIGICSVVLVVLIIIACSLGKDDEKKGGAPAGLEPLQEMVIESVSEQGDVVVMETSFCQVKIPYAFSDLIEVQPVNDGNQRTLKFYVMLDEQRHDLFSIIFNGMSGIRLGDISVEGRSSTIPVFAVIDEVHPGLEGDQRLTVLAAQDCFSEIVFSLNDNEGFVPFR